MKKSKLSKKKSEKISRAFSLMFNRAYMYKMDHPFTIQSIGEVHKTIVDGLNEFSPIVLIYNRDQFFIEEEPFELRLNNERMISHFKKAGIQSISFEKGIKKSEIDNFVTIFTDLKNYPNATLMKSALSEKRVSSLKINHVIYKKVTADDEVVSKDKLKDIPANSQSGASGQMYNEVVNMMAESILVEEVEKSISLEALLSDPQSVSKDMINKDLSMAQSGQAESSKPGYHVAHQLVQFRNEIQKATENTDNLSLSELADAVFDLKKQLIEGIQSQKELGIYYENETQIIEEANALTDEVLIRIVKDEYKKGEISVQRLAQILQRLIPEPNELRRLLPQLSKAMLEEGMSKADFFQLIEELGKELQNENLVSFLEEGAKNIGVTSQELISEFKNDPSSAAELIYLATEIRKGTGDETVLKDLLVEYIERLGSKIVLDDAKTEEEREGNHLKEVIAGVESEIVRKLEKKGIESEVMQAVQQRLTERMESCFNNLKEEWEKKLKMTPAKENVVDTTIFQILEESVEEGDELHDILKQVRSSIREQEIDENNFQQLYDEIQRRIQIQKKDDTQSQNGEKKNIPCGILNYKNTHLFLEKEIFRSLRYETPFSIITFSIEKIIPKQPIPSGAINGQQINEFIFRELISILRGADLVGILTKKIIAVLLPMTDKRNARIAMSRLLKHLHAKSFSINDISLSMKFVGAVTSFDIDDTPDLSSFIHAAENEHNDFIIRLRNIQDLY
jgi:hypothetical protein